MKTDSKLVVFGRGIKYVLVNSAVATVLYYAIFSNVIWCQNVLKFYLWVNFVLWILLTAVGTGETKKLIREKKPPIPIWVSSLWGVVFALVLAGSGWFWYAGVSIATTFMQVEVMADEDVCGGKITTKE